MECKMSDFLNSEQLKALAIWPSPAISNAIETFNVRSRNSGFMSSDIVCRFPELQPIVGYAVTCTIRSSIPLKDDLEVQATRDEWWSHIQSVPGPRIVVIQDLDDPPRGSFWGEVNGNVHHAMGCLGVITNGGVRDLDEVQEIGFQFLSKELLVSHAYVHQVEIGIPVTVGGLTIKAGDLLHADQHGCVRIPGAIAAQVAEASQVVEDRERVIIDYCKSPDFSVDGLRALYDAGVTFTDPREEL